MSQVPNTSPSDANYEVANSTGANVRGDINNILDAILTMNSGSSAPSYAKAYTLFADTNAGIMKMRNAANDGFINLFTLTGGVDVDAASNFNEDVTFTGASANIVFDKSDSSLEFADTARAKFGTGADLHIHHNATDSFISNDTGDLVLNNIGGNSDDIFIRSADDIELQVQSSEDAIKCIGNGAVQLYFDNAIKLATLTNGVDITGDLIIDGAAGGTLTLGGSSAHTSKLVIADNTGSSNGNLLVEGGDGGDFFTINSAGNVKFEDSKKALFGAGADLEVFHDGSNSHIADTGTGGLLIKGDSVNIGANSGEFYFRGFEDGAVFLRFDNSNKLETFASGAKWTGQFQGPVAGDSIQWTGSSSNAFLMAMSDGNDLPANSSTNMNFHHWNGSAWKKSYEFGRDALLLPDNIKLRCGTSSDLSIFHNGTKSFLENITGDLIAKTASSIFLEPATNESGVAVNANSSVDLYFDNTKRFNTLTNGSQCRGIMHVLSLDGNVNQHTEALYFSIGTNSSTTFTFSGMIGSATIVLGGYANAGQGALGFYVILGGAMFATQHYQVNELINSGMQNISVSTTKNNTSYVVTISNSSSSSSLGISGFIESTGSRVTVATS